MNLCETCPSPSCPRSPRASLGGSIVAALVDPSVHERNKRCMAEQDRIATPERAAALAPPEAPTAPALTPIYPRIAVFASTWIALGDRYLALETRDHGGLTFATRWAVNHAGNREGLLAVALRRPEDAPTGRGAFVALERLRELPAAQHGPVPSPWEAWRAATAALRVALRTPELSLALYGDQRVHFKVLGRGHPWLTREHLQAFEKAAAQQAAQAWKDAHPTNGPKIAQE